MVLARLTTSLDNEELHIISKQDTLAPTLFVVNASHTMSLPSWEADTRFLENKEKTFNVIQ